MPASPTSEKWGAHHEGSTQAASSSRSSSHGEHVGVDSNAAVHDATPTASAKRRRRARGPPPPDPLAFAGAIAPLTMRIQNVARDAALRTTS